MEGQVMFSMINDSSDETYSENRRTIEMRYGSYMSDALLNSVKTGVWTPDTVDLITYSNQSKMESTFIKEQLKKATPTRQAALRRMWEHPYSYEEMMNQVKRNEEIRRQNMLARLQKEKGETGL